MFRVVLASALLACALGLPGPASAGAKIIRVHANVPAPARSLRHRHRHPRIVALAVPRCLVKRSTAYAPACPRTAWAGSAPRQAWSYEVFRRQAQWEQRSDLWQSHIQPGASNPTIYWGY